MKRSRLAQGVELKLLASQYHIPPRIPPFQLFQDVPRLSEPTLP